MAIDPDALAKLIEKDGFKKVEFARTTGISLGYLGDILSGRTTLKRSPDLIKRFAQTLDVPVSMLMRRESA